MNRSTAIACLVVCTLPLQAAEMDGVKTIALSTSGSPAAQKQVLRGVATLHSFGWKQARAQIISVREIDPGRAMAYSRKCDFSVMADVACAHILTSHLSADCAMVFHVNTMRELVW